MTTPIICLCGSARFEAQFKHWNQKLTLSGFTVFSLAVYPTDHEGNKNWYTVSEKAALDAAHLRKIASSHIVLVLNHDGYVGESTIREMLFAQDFGKAIMFLDDYLVVPEAEENGFVKTNDAHQPFQFASKQGLPMPGVLSLEGLYSYANGDLYGLLADARAYYRSFGFRSDIVSLRDPPVGAMTKNPRPRPGFRALEPFEAITPLDRNPLELNKPGPDGLGDRGA